MKLVIICGSCETRSVRLLTSYTEKVDEQLSRRLVRHAFIALFSDSYESLLDRVAPSIYYLGVAGSVLINGLRISGASGIFNERHYYSGMPSVHSDIEYVLIQVNCRPFRDYALRQLYYAIHLPY